MPWNSVRSDYIPAAGERVKFTIEYGHIGTGLSRSDAMQLLRAANIVVVDVSTPLVFVPFSARRLDVVLEGDGQHSMSELGVMVSEALNEAASVWGARAAGYYRWQTSLVPEPTPTQTVTIAAFAVIAVVAFLVLRKTGVL